MQIAWRCVHSVHIFFLFYVFITPHAITLERGDALRNNTKELISESVLRPRQVLIVVTPDAKLRRALRTGIHFSLLYSLNITQHKEMTKRGWLGLRKNSESILRPRQLLL
jgi:hypothetical protein